MYNNNNNNQRNDFGFGRDRILHDLRTVQAEKKRQIKLLEAKKKELTESLKTLTINDKWSSDKKSKGYLTLPNVYGYVLSQFNVSQVNNDEKLYSAQCEEKDMGFGIFIQTTNSDVVTKISISMNARSALLEIKDTLAILAEERCPHLILSTISQFVSLNNFRKQTIDNIRRKTQLLVFWPTFAQGNFGSPWVITTKQMANTSQVEIQWTMDWDRSFVALVHRFLVACSNVNPELQEKLNQLHHGTFKVQNQESLASCLDQITQSIT
ncbi:hypothetical protein FOCC_FOCC006970 [Frankliniella occidentalis]|uniref:Uncharacterized protein LOC113211253 n=1 Tax=Frankliniella occidentalis TaxID=133901 RepID=A0A6J1T1B0_FRAOC|nr:uncharacterized protein LOC113211253 [Frankliniella occidentalis]KAE8746297.1 hypothetical protein FOCC_FOCC006970 [Frankliniella occidentalis]